MTTSKLHHETSRCDPTARPSGRRGNNVETSRDGRRAAGRLFVSNAGCILADRGDTYGAIEYFERAVDMDPHHSQALFRLASENALYGNDNEAIRLYEQGLSKAPFFTWVPC